VKTWDHNTVVFDRNRDVHEIVGLTVANFPTHPGLMKWFIIPAFGFLLVAAFFRGRRVIFSLADDARSFQAWLSDVMEQVQDLGHCIR
jgi:hypothetical protein